jgi:hypothetical protein
MPEYYFSLLFNELIQSVKRVGLVTGRLERFGTPEELARYETQAASDDKEKST